MVGRPKRWLDRFDLVIAPPQFQVPSRPNVLHLDLPLMRVDEAAVATAADAWRPRFADLPRPLLALLVGGPTKPYVFDGTVARRLIEECRHITEAAGGTLYVTTSRRTPAAVVEAIAAALPAGARLYRWDAGGDNPYHALLGLADRFVVTGDSISMMVEVARLGKPLAIFALPASGDWLRLRSALGQRLAALGDAVGRPSRLARRRALPAAHRQVWARPVGNPPPPVCARARRTARPAVPAAADARRRTI